MKRFICILVVMLLFVSLIPVSRAEDDVEALKKRIEELEAELAKKDAIIEALINNGNSNKPDNKPKEVELTTENISDYLAVRFDFSRVERKQSIGMSFGYTDLTTDIYSTASGSFKDVRIKMRVLLPYSWSVSSIDSAYVEGNDRWIDLDFRLPSSGSFTEVHHLIASIVFSDPDYNEVGYYFSSVSGTFIPS